MAIFLRNKMSHISIFFLSFIAMAPIMNVPAQTNNGNIHVRLEHVALNVPEPAAAAQWYVKNLGMKIVRQGTDSAVTTFISDSGGHMMLELFHNIHYPLLEPATISHMSIHFAFVADSLEELQSKLLASGATIAENLKTTASGDKVMSLRDPWGWTIQFVQRRTPMLNSKGLYAEHFAVNVTDARAKADWYIKNLGMVMMRQGGAPGYGTFIADSGENMMMEIYQNADYPVADFNNISHMSTHLAFSTDDIMAMKKKLLIAGATLVDDITTTASGDQVLMIRDPWGEPIQLVKRLHPMLK
jgi:catechol 2,3-dioxygenase-like lactoylglutathione lyase family enzyme